MYVIFLDIAGTIDPLRNSPDRAADDMVDRACVRRVNCIARSVGAKVVLSTDWVADPEDFPWVSKALRDHGLEPEIIGRTDQPPLESASWRHHQIQRWLDQHPEVKGFVILDDFTLLVGRHRDEWLRYSEADELDHPHHIPDLPRMAAHFVKVDALHGLQDPDVERAIRILAGLGEGPRRVTP